MNAQKTKLRQELKQQRMVLTPAQIDEKSRAIADRLRRSVKWPDVKSLHCYAPIKSLNEVDVLPFMEFLQKEYPEIGVYGSVKRGKGWRIINLRSGGSGEEQKFDVVIVPMLGFDSCSLYRIGYGGGYYDRLLAAQPQAQKLGVCFELGKVAKLPIEPHDISLDKIITELVIYDRGNA